MKTKTVLIPQNGVISLFGSFMAATVVVCCFLTSCNNKEDILNQAYVDDGISTSKSLEHGRVFTVSPSGNYNDDSYKIQTALDAALVAGPGSTVKLMAGTFYLKDKIEVQGFEGCFKGAGKDKTILTTHDKIYFDIPDYQIPSLIKFRCGNISMSDMSIIITDPEPCINEKQDWWGNILPCVVMISGNDIEPGSEGQKAKFTFNNMKFVGGNGNVWGLNYNIQYFILAGWESNNNVVYPLTGGYKVTNCDFKQAYFSFMSIYTGGPCIIGGDVKSGNKFEETEVGVATIDVNSSFCNTSYNIFDRIHWLGVMPYQGMYADPNTLPLSKFIVSHNNIGLNSYSPGEAGFTIGINPVDYGIFAGTSTVPKIDAVVSYNRVQINDIGFGGIIGQDLQNAVITNNTVCGKGTTGIGGGFWLKPPAYLEYDQEIGYLIKGNNLKGMDASVAPIWLGAGTSNFLVYADKADVLDEGVNNTVIGDHNKRTGHHGPEINHGMIRHHDRIKFHNHQGIK